jgi:hypothetical protein
MAPLLSAKDIAAAGLDSLIDPGLATPTPSA